jgi:signal transduction histidine kinase
VREIEVVPIILDTLCRLTGMGFAAVARVTEDRWIACAVRDEIAFGLEPGAELQVETTICHEIRACGEPVIIDDVDADPVYATHHTPALYGLKSYISIPIVLEGGRFFGTLCAIDPKPAHVSRPEVVNTFKLFASLIGMHLDAHERLRRTEETLLDERATAQLREQFIAVLGHDLRNPLGSIVSGTSLLEREPQTERALRILSVMRKSANRMAELINDVLDFARGRLGGGLSLERRSIVVEPLLAQVVDELQAAHPELRIEMDCTADQMIDCDPRRLAQLVSNLVGNAITHGSATKPVRVECGISDGAFKLSVTNSGVQIPEAARRRLFGPFERAAGGASRDGLGLGLYIASTIAAAHGGALSCNSTPEATTFTFEMPLPTE